MSRSAPRRTCIQEMQIDFSRPECPLRAHQDANQDATQASCVGAQSGFPGRWRCVLICSRALWAPRPRMASRASITHVNLRSKNDATAAPWESRLRDRSGSLRVSLVGRASRNVIRTMCAHSGFPGRVGRIPFPGGLPSMSPDERPGYPTERTSGRKLGHSGRPGRLLMRVQPADSTTLRNAT